MAVVVITPQLQKQDVIGLALSDRKPRGLLLDAGMRHGDGFDVETVLLGQRLEDDNRIPAVGAVVIDQRDLPAFEIANSAELVGNVLYRDLGCGPRRAQQREVPLEDAAVLQITTPAANSHD